MVGEAGVALWLDEERYKRESQRLGGVVGVSSNCTLAFITSRLQFGYSKKFGTQEN